MGAFLSIGRGALFFAPRGGKCCDGLEARSRPSISWSARDVGERSLVKAEAAGGGGRRPAFTRLRSPTTIAWRDRGADSMSVRGSIPDRDDCVVDGMRQLLVRVDSDGSSSGPGTHAVGRRGGGVRCLGLSRCAEGWASVRVFISGEVWISRRSRSDPRRPFMRLRPKACMLVSGGVVGTPDHYA